MVHGAHPRLGAASARFVEAVMTSDVEVLRKILKHVPFTQRREICPLVCKKVCPAQSACMALDNPACM